MKRPLLTKIPLSEVTLAAGTGTMTMSVGQWDGLLQAAYSTGWTLLELDRNENLVAAYRRTINSPGENSYAE